MSTSAPVDSFGNSTAAAVQSTAQRFFGYEPSQGAAIAFAIIFFALAAAQFYLYWKHRPDGFMLVLACTALIGEGLGFVVRIVAMHNPTIANFIVTTLLILLSPCLTALVNYIVCGRILNFTGQSVGCLRPAWIAKIFMVCDVVTLFIQSGGGGLTISSDPKMAKLGKDTVTAGLVIQMVSFCLFIWIAVSIQFMRRYGFRDNCHAQRIFWSIHATMVCFIVRTLYRFVEFNSGADGYARTHEWCFYVFEASCMALAFVVYSWPLLHFGYNLNQLSREVVPSLGLSGKFATGSISLVAASTDPLDQRYQQVHQQL